MKDYKKT